MGAEHTDSIETRSQFARFEPKTEWERDDCMFCESRATLQAIYGKAMVRCCENEVCKKKAERIALGMGMK